MFRYLGHRGRRRREYRGRHRRTPRARGVRHRADPLGAGRHRGRRRQDRHAPLLVATSGDALLQEEAVATLRDELLPAARIITPNIPEAELLLGAQIERQETLSEAARALSRMGRGVSVFLKAGHLDDEELVDIFYNAETDEIVPLRSRRLATRNTHGTGCTLSSALAAFLAHGCTLNEAAAKAKAYIAAAIEAGAAYEIGHGHGPVHHFFGFWE